MFHYTHVSFQNPLLNAFKHFHHFDTLIVQVTFSITQRRFLCTMHVSLNITAINIQSTFQQTKCSLDLILILTLPPKNFRSGFSLYLPTDSSFICDQKFIMPEVNIHGNGVANMSFERNLFLDCFFARAMKTSTTQPSARNCKTKIELRPNMVFENTLN